MASPQRVDEMESRIGWDAAAVADEAERQQAAAHLPSRFVAAEAATAPDLARLCTSARVACPAQGASDGSPATPR